jgi:type IV secretion system protein VirD4
LQVKAIIEKLKNTFSSGRNIAFLLIALYFVGMVINSVGNGISNTFEQTDKPLLVLNPITNIFAIFTPTGLGMLGLAVISYCLLTKKGYSLITGYKTILDKERNIEILPEGTHGTSNWLSAKEVTTSRELANVFDNGTIKNTQNTILGKLEIPATFVSESKTTYIGIKERMGMNNNILVYGAPGTGKSQGFAKPFIMQAAERGESIVLVDPKGEFFEAYSQYLRDRGYDVKVFNLLDMEHSDGMNCFSVLENDSNLVQAIAEIIINNTSNASEKMDFWEKSEKNLLMALLHYVLTMTDDFGNLLPIEQRSIGTIYRMLATHNIAAFDKKFRALPKGHPALPPYGIFKQANPQILGNIIIGLGSRLNVFQNKMVDKITSHSDIDLELPGKQKCAYFCIISDQESSMEFMSSMFFSLLFVRLSDYARKFGENRRLPVSVNVLLDEFCNIGKLLDFKKVLSTARSRGINIQIIIQSLAQLADRYPKTEWEEIVGNCDCQLFLGCNDQMTAKFMSEQCGEMTIRVNDSVIPMTPLFSPILSSTRQFTHNKTSTGRALILPDEVRRLPDRQSIVLVRGQKPLKLTKIIPDEHPAFEKLTYTKITKYKPSWCDEPDVVNTVGTEQFTKDFKDVQKAKQKQTATQNQNCAEIQILETAASESDKKPILTQFNSPINREDVK